MGNSTSLKWRNSALQIPWVTLKVLSNHMLVSDTACMCCSWYINHDIASRNIFDHQAKTFSSFCWCSPSYIWSCLGLHGEHQHLGPNKRPSRQDWVSQVSLAPPLHWLLLLVNNLSTHYHIEESNTFHIVNDSVPQEMTTFVSYFILVLNHFKTPSQMDVALCCYTLMDEIGRDGSPGGWNIEHLLVLIINL